MITKRQFIRAAEMVKAIREGAWTHEAPSWVEHGDVYDGNPSFDHATVDYTRAVQTAEALILLFSENNPRFDRARFLHACGLGPKPVSKRRTAFSDRL